jgi:hypothetical protein
MEGLRPVELARLLLWGPRLSQLLEPGSAPSVRGQTGAALTLLSGRTELWEAASVAVAFASQVDEDPADLLTAVGALGDRQRPQRFSEAVSSSAAQDTSGILARRGFAHWISDLPIEQTLMSTSSIVSASRVIVLALPGDLIRKSSIAMANLDVCVEICKGKPPQCLLECLEPNS